MIRLGQITDGRLVLGSNESFPADVKYVEYNIDQRLFILVFDTKDEQNELMPCPLCKRTAAIVHASPSIMIVPMADPDGKSYGYTVPLIQIGV